MMQITFLLSSLWLSGGVRVIVEYSNYLAQRGHQISLVCPKDAHSTEIDEIISPRLRVIESNISIADASGFWGKFRLAISLANAVPLSDVVVSTHTPTTLATFIACSLDHKGLPLWLYMDYPGMFGSRPVEAWLLRNANRWHKAALVLSSHSAEEINRFSKKDAIVIGLGISNFDLFKDLCGKYKSRINTSRSILYLGDFRPRKGLRDFLAAAESVYDQHPDIELWIALKEPGEVECRVPHRIITRPTTQDLAQLYATCDLFVSSSWYEGFGLPPLEAMACGAPVVTTDSGGVQEYVHPGQNCLLVPPKDPVKLSEAMLQVLNSPDLVERFRQNGPLTADQYTWEKATDRFELALRDLSGFS